MRTILLNSTNVVSGTNNSRYRVDLPAGSNHFKDCEVAVSSVSLYYSWNNISSAQGNNAFSYVFPTSSGTTTVSLTIPDGSYSISDLNSWLQSQMIANGHYLVDSNGDYLYWIELTTNAVYYSVQLVSYAVPTALPSGYSNPASMTFPATATTPQLVVPSTNIRDILGFTAGSYPSVTQATTYTTYSSYTPQVSPTQSVIMTCNLVVNGLTNPPNVLYSFSPSGTSFGSIIESKPNAFTWIEVNDGYYNSVDIQLYNQSYTPLVIKDSNVVIVLVLQKKQPH